MTHVRTFREDLDRAVAFHGHLCGGQIMGTRIARAALAHFGIEDADTYPNLIAFVEADRCLADAITVVAACHIGKKRLKWYDYGKMAASFYDLTTQQAIRVHSKPGNRSPEGASHEEMIAFYEAIPDEELLALEAVDIALTQYDVPGKPLRSVPCTACGETVHDNRDVLIDGKPYCKPCAGEQPYYKDV